MELPQQDGNKPRTLPLYRLHEPLYGLHKLIYGLPDMNVLPDVVELPDGDKTVFLARWGRGIIGSEKTTWSTTGMPWSPVPEVAGQLCHAAANARDRWTEKPHITRS